MIDTLQTQLASHQNSMLSLLGFVRTTAQGVVAEMVNDDNPQPDNNLDTALIELIRQMIEDGESVDRNASTATVTEDSDNNSDASILVSLVSNRGNNLQNVYAEDIKLLVTADAQQGGGATAGQEQLSVKSEIAVSNKLNADFPKGSGVSVSFSFIDASGDNAGGNLLTNGDFQDFDTGGAPSNWSLDSGSISEIDASLLSCVSGQGFNFVGDGSSTFQISQTFNDSTNGTAGVLEPLSVYAWNIWLNLDSVPAAGELVVELVDSDTGLVLADEKGTDNSFSIDLTSMSADECTAAGQFIRTPRIMPDSVEIRLSMSTALSNTVTLTVDHFAVGAATELYTHGPYVAAFSGALQNIREDEWTITLTNDRAGLIQTSFERLFDMNAKRLQLPIEEAATSPTIDDSLFQ